MGEAGFYLRKAAQHVGPVSVSGGSSGYFSRPAQGLDPHIFDGQHLKPSVRSWILGTLHNFWAPKYRGFQAWSTIWLAGSGISYQWAADRGNGDLDVLVGVDWPGFIRSNPRFEGLTPEQMADHIDVELKSELWPRTSHQNFLGQTYEVTYFVNAGGADIRNINPYAAYNVSTDAWTIRPPDLPRNPSKLYPNAWFKAVAGEARTITDLVDRYGNLSRQQAHTHPGTPGYANATTALHGVTSQARTLFDDIHHGRRQAFAPGGAGYGDWHNFRWQAHKQQGTAQALAKISAVDHDASEHLNRSLYGVDLGTPDALITRALLAHRGIA